MARLRSQEAFLDKVESMRAIQLLEAATGQPHPNRPKYPELPPFDTSAHLKFTRPGN